MSTADPAPPPASPVEKPVVKPPLKVRLKALFKEYGELAIYLYLGLSLLTIAGFSIAFGFGFGASDATGVLGVIAAGWVASKATMPIRIPIILAITPPIARILRKRKQAKIDRGELLPDEDDEDDDDDDDDDED